MSENDNSRHHTAKTEKRIEEMHHTVERKADALSSRPCSELRAASLAGAPHVVVVTLRHSDPRRIDLNL
jgi:hypothetical protein